MICVECSYPHIDTLYSEFKSKYIKLTTCPRCGKLADKYIEFDYVIVFLDILLLRPQAYRHLAYNLVHRGVFSDIDPTIPFFRRYKKLLRYAALAILFEVYLNWAYEERTQLDLVIAKTVLQNSVPVQYGFFIFRQCVEKLVVCGVIVGGTISKLDRRDSPARDLPAELRRGYHVSVVLVTVFLSQAIRCLPVIMLIWPYDTHVMASLAVDILAFFNTVEALRCNVTASYMRTVPLVLASLVASLVARKVAVAGVMAVFSPHLHFFDLLVDEIMS